MCLMNNINHSEFLKFKSDFLSRTFSTAKLMRIRSEMLLNHINFFGVIKFNDFNLKISSVIRSFSAVEIISRLKNLLNLFFA